jgi:hypothetical protein
MKEIFLALLMITSPVGLVGAARAYVVGSTKY